MIIKKRPILTWLLSPDEDLMPMDVVLSTCHNQANYGLLKSYFELLGGVRTDTEWGLPELLMPSFEKVMEKNAPSFTKVMPSLFEEFSKTGECGILINKVDRTIVYGFSGGELHLWCFTEQKNKSVFKFYAKYICVNGELGVGIESSFLSDDYIFNLPIDKRRLYVATMGSFIASYVAVKKYVEIETVIVPIGVFTDIKDTPLEYVDKGKVINNLGQEVYVMDSRWFRKIVNDNDIPVRGFWRLQNKKNIVGEWVKELIFVKPFVRHGYHRRAAIEDDGVE